MSTFSIDWNSPISGLFSSKGPSKTAVKLNEAGYKTLNDLLWILPLRIVQLPTFQSFKLAQIDSMFRGMGKILSVQTRPNFKTSGKGKAPLANITVTIQDRFSPDTISLKWFNCYPSQVKKIESLDKISFLGEITSFNGQLQIVNPDHQVVLDSEYERDLDYWSEFPSSIKVQYPTINGIGPANITKLFKKLPDHLWDHIDDPLESLEELKGFLPLKQAFKILHGQTDYDLYEKERYKAEDRLIFQEFFQDQLKILSRKSLLEEKKGIQISKNEDKLKDFISYFPYPLTTDQEKVIHEIMDDFSSSKPMMRLVQGDVGSGKTTVAILAGLMAIADGYQVALMCPTESLALQHFLTLSELFKDKGVSVGLLLGSQKPAKKKEVQASISSGEIQFIIGTHSLFQESVHYKNLGLAIIDEQHKFGVNQRIKLVSKNEGCHCLLMSATPIPRSLSLTQYGDLEISVIKTMPSDRKGTKTRIVQPDTFDKFLTFLNTRISMGEQAYVVVPAITESEMQDITNLESVLARFKKFFPKYRISGLHGQLSSDEKQQTFLDFKEHKIDILIATSVIEVGINVTNSTIMAIMNPERFGLSSLHQLRGRVGRGEKPGFCFLVNDKKISPHSMERLKVIENNTDGFIISEEDLRLRGEGNLFGVQQSGETSTKVLANIILHQPILIEARALAVRLFEEKNEIIQKQINQFKTDPHITETV
ncbi:MAG: ATP-dependent DNA helicase RecG [Oligoflexia bacterium]|nr:ATP-dependent DNA helicase RecG [Oligoflexia bacterium]